MKQSGLSGILGSKNVVYDESILQSYSRDMSLTATIRPVAVVKPRNADDVLKIVGYARQTKTPLVPVSSGTPHFRGDTVPTAGGAIIVDLSGMKKVIHIDRKNRIAMFEPGVTFSELSDAVAKEGMRLNMPLLPRKSKSVVGSLLEREPVLMPVYHWDIADPLACTEVVFGTGDMFRTGAAAGSGTIEEQWAAGGAQKEAAGPSSSSWYRLIQGSQGTFGIVTWVSARVELTPKLEVPFFVGSSHLDKILDLVHWLIRLRLVNECLVLNSTNLALIMSKKASKDYQRIKQSLPPWILFFNIAAYDYYPEERIAGQTKDMQALMQRMSMQAVPTLSEISASEFLATIQKPSADPYWKLKAQGNCQDIMFLANYDKIPVLVHDMQYFANTAGYSGAEIGVYLQPIVQGVNCHCEFNLFYNPEDAAMTAMIKNLNKEATRKLMANGAFFSRPYAETTGMIMNRDAATVATLKKVKSIVDPDNILNPGKLCF